MQTFIIATLAAGLASWIFGAVWYMALGPIWQRALGMDPDACKDKKMPPLPLVVALLAAFVIAAVLQQLLLGMGMLGVMTVWDGALAGFTVGFGFMLTTVLVNNMFRGAKFAVTLVDGGHWVLATAIQGAVIAALT